MPLIEAVDPAEDVASTTVPGALRDIACGRPVILERSEGGADLVIAGEFADSRAIAFLVKHTSGLLSVALPASRCDELKLPPMVPDGDTKQDGSAVSVDATEGVSTGISARDRARTIRLLASNSSRPQDLRRPGHVLPIRAHPDGVLRRASPAEACVDLCRLAHLNPAGVRSELLRHDGAIPSDADISDFANGHGLVRLGIGQLIAYRRAFDLVVHRVDDWRMRTEYGDVHAITFLCAHDGTEHLALLVGNPATKRAPMVRVHQECLRSHVFGARDCCCSKELRKGLLLLNRSPSGVLVYVRNGATIAGRHTGTACHTTESDYIAAAILRQLGIERSSVYAA